MAFGLNASSGVIIFYPNQTEGRIYLEVLDDSMPEINEGYLIQIKKVVTEGLNFMMYIQIIFYNNGTYHSNQYLKSYK